MTGANAAAFRLASWFNGPFQLQWQPGKVARGFAGAILASARAGGRWAHVSQRKLRETFLKGRPHPLQIGESVQFAQSSLVFWELPCTIRRLREVPQQRLVVHTIADGS
jgi:hypothetical protein